MRTKMLSGILLWLALSLLLPSATPAAVVGRITQVEGRVDLLKKGQLPATPAKHNDGVEPGDVVRTKSFSKAQITFVDQTILTIAPGSRIAIEKYMVEGGKRNAVLQMFQGVALAVVSKIFKAKDPDFVVKTHTAIMGVRGTEVGIRLYPNFSEFLNFQGRTSISNRFPEIRGVVELSDGQGTRVTRGLPPTIAFGVSPQDREQFMHQLATGLNARVRDQDSNPGSSGSQGNQLALGSSGHGPIMLVSVPPNVQPSAQIAPPKEKPKTEAPPPPVQIIVENEPVTPEPTPVTPVVEPIITPEPTPEPTPVTPEPEIQTINYEKNYNGTYQMSFSEGHQAATFTGLITFTSTNVQAEFVIEATDPSTPGNFAKNSSGNIQWTLSGDLTRQGSTGAYTGTLWAIGTTDGGTVFKFPLAASYLDGKLTLTSGPVAGDYNSTSILGFDFTSPGASHKITQGTATISWNLGAIPTPTPAPTPTPTPEPTPEPTPTPSVTTKDVNWSRTGSYTMTSEKGHQDAIFTGSLTLANNSQVNFTVVVTDPSAPGNFAKSSKGNINWVISGSLNLTEGSTSQLTATGTTDGGTVFTFPLQAKYEGGKLTLTGGPVTGTYALDTDKSVTYDFTSPGSSHKITPGSATISWTTPTSTTTAASGLMQTSTTPTAATATATATSAAMTATAPAVTPTSTTSISAAAPASASSGSVTATAPALTQTSITPIATTATATSAAMTATAPAVTATSITPVVVTAPVTAATTTTSTIAATVTPTSITPIAPTAPTISVVTPASAVPAAAASPVITALPSITTLTPPATAPGQAVAATAPGQVATVAATVAPVALTPIAPPVVTPSGVAAPGLQNLPAALNGPPGQSNAPGQGGDSPGNAYAKGHSK